MNTSAHKFIGFLAAWILPAFPLFIAPTSVVANVNWQTESESPVISETISFESHGAHLQGTLYLPAKGDRLPALVIMHGAEAPTREYDMYRHLAQDLPALGYAVLVFDRRGSGASTGSLDDAGYEQLADDGIAGLHAIEANPRVNGHKIGFWGHSQGGWLAILAASRCHEAAFAISVSAPMVTPSEQMKFAVANLLTLRGQQSAIIQATKTRDRWEGFLRGSNSRADAVAALTAIEHEPWFSSVFMPRAEDLVMDPLQSTWSKEKDLDPVVAFKQVKVPTLFFYGGADPWVPAAASRKRLNELALTHPSIEVHVIEGADHAMEFNPHETMDFDKATILSAHPEAPRYFFLLANWLDQNTR